MEKLISKQSIFKVCTFFGHNAIAHVTDYCIVKYKHSFICTGKPRNSCDLLY